MRSQVHDSEFFFVELDSSDKKISMSLDSLGHLAEDLLKLVDDGSSVLFEDSLQ